MSLARHRIARYAVVVACSVLAAASLADYLDGRRQRRELQDLLSGPDFGRRSAAVLERIGTERTAHHARILAGRFLLYDVLDVGGDREDTIAVGSQEKPTALEVGSPGWNAAVDRLTVAADLARQVLTVQPNSWQASMLLGAAVYLERSIRRDGRLYTSYRDWETPLSRAVHEAPGQAEPRRFLAAAYLEVWSALSGEKKEAARRILAEAFANDPRSFGQLLPAWLPAARDLDEAFAVIPDRASAWRKLERAFAERREWEAFCHAYERRLTAVFEEHRLQLAEAETRLALGEFFHSRSLLLQVVAASPLDVRFAPQVERALELYPPGLHGLSSTERVRRWLRWTLELHVFGRDVLAPSVVSRLASAAGQLDAPEQALAALVAGEVYHAESFERSAESLTKEKWGTYLIAKAPLARRTRTGGRSRSDPGARRPRDAAHVGLCIGPPRGRSGGRRPRGVGRGRP